MDKTFALSIESHPQIIEIARLVAADHYMSKARKIYGKRDISQMRKSKNIDKLREALNQAEIIISSDNQELVRKCVEADQILSFQSDTRRI